MTIDDLNRVLTKGEGITIEYKKSQGGIPASLYETISSFSNTDGGTIVLGADDTGKVLGLIPSDIPQFIKDIVACLHNPATISPSIYLSPITVKHPEGVVIVLQVPASSQIHRYAKKVYWRSDDNDQDVTDDEQKISDIYFKKRNYFTENEIFPYLSMHDLDLTLFEKARLIIHGVSATHPWLSMSSMEMLQSSSLFRKDFKTGEEGLTRAAAMVFGTDSTIQHINPGYKIDALVRRVNVDRYDDRLELKSNLIDSYLALNGFIKKHLDEKFYTEGGQRKDLRELIFREVIGNMIVHREYTSAVSSELVIYKNEVIVSNPNKPLFKGALDLNSFNPYPKNPNIRKFFNAFGWTDELGSGVRNTKKYLAVYAPGAIPSFIEGDNFMTEIPLISLTLASYHDKLVAWFVFNEDIASWLQDGLLLCRLDPSLADASWTDLILYLVPSWTEKGTQLQPLDWPKNQVFREEEVKKVPSWAEKGTELLHKKTSYLIRILLFTLKPIALEQLLAWIEYSNKNTFRQNYLLPLQKVGFIKMTKPDQPNAKDQKYVITENGKLFLTGRLNP